MKLYKSPMYNPITSAGALLCTVTLAIGILPLKKSGSVALEYLNGVVNERGPVSYGLIYIFSCLIISSIVARIRKDYSPHYRAQYKLYCAYLPLFGIVGTVLGIGGTMSSLGAYFSSYGNSDSSGQILAGVTSEILASVTSGLAVAFDTTLLGLVLLLISMSNYGRMIEGFSKWSNQRLERTA